MTLIDFFLAVIIIVSPTIQTDRTNVIFLRNLFFQKRLNVSQYEGSDGATPFANGGLDLINVRIVLSL